ncbi:hypothetical protein DSO57_1000329 [Entomophthora muscae]|uniref:Uncharacterized protein n=1 Tax=Entomophthora muscae TaxID=34485 RepID=A0ACC2TKN6_9FUNG|nr:hypothetical protein DSO57_1000329 [Entomophthora muscae]
MIEKVNPVLDTSYEPYISDGNQENNNELKFFQTVDGQQALKKVDVFYTKVPMPCIPGSEKDPDSTTPSKASWKHIINIMHIILWWDTPSRKTPSRKYHLEILCQISG